MSENSFLRDFESKTRLTNPRASSRIRPYYYNSPRITDVYRGRGPAAGPGQVYPGFRAIPPLAPPPRTPQPRARGFRPNNIHTISRGLIHIHPYGKPQGEVVCPGDSSCVAIEEVSDFFYNKARKCQHLLNEINRNRNPELAPITENSPLEEFVSLEPGPDKIDLVVGLGPNTNRAPINCWNPPVSSDSNT